MIRIKVHNKELIIAWNIQKCIGPINICTIYVKTQDIPPAWPAVLESVFVQWITNSIEVNICLVIIGWTMTSHRQAT